MTRRKNSPRLMHSDLTGQVYVVTRYTIRSIPGQEGRGVLIAHEKYDVTSEFESIAKAKQEKGGSSQ